MAFHFEISTYGLEIKLQAKINSQFSLCAADMVNKANIFGLEIKINLNHIRIETDTLIVKGHQVAEAKIWWRLRGRGEIFF